MSTNRKTGSVKVEDLNETERNTLVAIRHQRNRLAAREEKPDHLTVGSPLAKLDNLRIREARAGWIKLNLAELLGHEPTDSEQVMSSRAWQRLDELGLVKRRYAGGGIRTTHLALTNAGQVLAVAVEDWRKRTAQIQRKVDAEIASWKTLCDRVNAGIAAGGYRAPRQINRVKTVKE